jgi:hypothetical protein
MDGAIEYFAERAHVVLRCGSVHKTRRPSMARASVFSSA